MAGVKQVIEKSVIQRPGGYLPDEVSEGGGQEKHVGLSLVIARSSRAGYTRSQQRKTMPRPEPA